MITRRTSAPIRARSGTTGRMPATRAVRRSPGRRRRPADVPASASARTASVASSLASSRSQAAARGSGGEDHGVEAAGHEGVHRVGDRRRVGRRAPAVDLEGYDGRAGRRQPASRPSSPAPWCWTAIRWPRTPSVARKSAISADVSDSATQSARRPAAWSAPRAFGPRATSRTPSRTSSSSSASPAASAVSSQPRKPIAGRDDQDVHRCGEDLTGARQQGLLVDVGHHPERGGDHDVGATADEGAGQLVGSTLSGHQDPAAGQHRPSSRLCTPGDARRGSTTPSVTRVQPGWATGLRGRRGTRPYARSKTCLYIGEATVDSFPCGCRRCRAPSRWPR